MGGGKEAEDKVIEVDKGQMCKILWAKVSFWILF